MEILASEEFFDKIVDLVREKRHGVARQMLAIALGGMKNPKAVDVLIDLLDDDDIVGHALISLKKLKARQARTPVLKKRNHSNAWVRQQAKRALDSLGG